MSLRDVITEIGITASTAALSSPAPLPKMRRTVSKSNGTARVPASASGNFSASELNPSTLIAATCSQSSNGGLSIETLPPGSNAAKKKLCHE